MRVQREVDESNGAPQQETTTATKDMVTAPVSSKYSSTKKLGIKPTVVSPI